MVADIKTFDNAKYEFELCFRAGADIATVMGAAPPVTLRTCMDTAGQFGRQVMVDLLNTQAHQQAEIARLENIIVCQHISKDQQEEGGGGTWGAPCSIAQPAACGGRGHFTGKFGCCPRPSAGCAHCWFGNQQGK